MNVTIEEQAKSINGEFGLWIKHNKAIYERFERVAIEAANKGFRNYSARTVAEYLRHHTALRDSNVMFKINNNVVPMMARLFAVRNPAHKELFKFRG
jgi:hypothetical protein